MLMNYKNIYILFILTLIGFSSKSQSNPQLITDYDFVTFDSNFIHFYSDSANYNRLFSKLDSLIFEGEGKINLMQIGGSHIQADIWSDQMRKNFQNLSPNLNGGRGFLFPYKLAKTNNPYYYKVTYTGEWDGYRNSVSKHHSNWGVSGITATTKDSVSSFKIVFRGDNTPYYDFNSIKVFHDLDSTSFCLELISDTCASIEVNHEIGYTEFKFDNHQDSLEFSIYQTDSNQTHFNLYGLSLENDDNGIVYNSIGVNGASTASYLRCEMFSQHLQAINPDLVIFCIGINDAFDPDFCPSCYERNYDTLVSWIRSVNPDCQFLFVTNNDSYFKRRYPNKRVFEAKEVMMNLAKKYNSGMWDMFEVMGGLGSIKTWERNAFAKRDKIHLTADGYKLMGDLMFAALMKEYQKYLQKKQSGIN